MSGVWNLRFFWLLIVVPPIILTGTANAGAVEKGNDGPQFRLLRRNLAADETAEPSSSIITVDNATEHGEPGNPAPRTGIIDNIASGKPANQSSTDENRDASKAANGVRQDYSLTLNTRQKWWMVDLGRQYHLILVNIFNIDDRLQWYRLKRFSLLIADDGRPIPSLDPPATPGWRNISYFRSTIQGSRSVTLDTFSDGRPRYETGRYIAIYSVNHEALSLAEVKVQGAEVVNCSTPPYVDNADQTEQGTGFDAIASYTCRQGYRLIGEANIECQQDLGVWMIPPVCEQCQCRGPGAASATCDVDTATCRCNAGYGGTECDTCRIGVTGTSCDSCDTDYFGYPSCSICNCNNIGANSTICDSNSGQCDCKSDFKGDKCDECADGQQSFPNCLTTTVPTTSPTTSPTASATISPNISAHEAATQGSPKPRDLSLAVIVMSGAFWLVNLLRCSADFINWNGQ